MVVYKNYGKGFLGASLISAIGGVCGFAALSAIIILIRGGFKEPQYLIIVVLGLISYFAFRRLAEIVYQRKAQRLKKKEAPENTDKQHKSID